MSVDSLLTDARLPLWWLVAIVCTLTVALMLLAHSLLALVKWLTKGAAAENGSVKPATAYVTTGARVGLHLFTAVLGNRLLLPSFASFSPLPENVDLALKIGTIVSFAWLLIGACGGLRRFLDARFDISVPDNLRSRRMRTQIGFIERIVDMAIVLITMAIVLAQFESGRRLSTGLLASAGVASLVVGLAAQRTIANLIAGFQIAFTQPIRIDDAVVVENEWGWIEEISLTYVVVRVWDRRRLVLPITYFVEKPFQNWTRRSGQILGSVFLEVAHHTPFEELDRELDRLLRGHPLWDGDARVLQVVEVQERSVQLRALMTARNSPECWDLRCDVRRGLLEFLVRNYPDCLPMTRLSVVNGTMGDPREVDGRKQLEKWGKSSPSSPVAS